MPIIKLLSKKSNIIIYLKLDILFDLTNLLCSETIFQHINIELINMKINLMLWICLAMFDLTIFF